MYPDFWHVGKKLPPTFLYYFFRFRCRTVVHSSKIVCYCKAKPEFLNIQLPCETGCGQASVKAFTLTCEKIHWQVLLFYGRCGERWFQHTTPKYICTFITRYVRRENKGNTYFLILYFWKLFHNNF